LWVSDPRQQLAYLATKRWARLHAPDVMLGVYTVDELQDAAEIPMGQAEVIPTEPTTSRTEAVKAALAGRGKAKVAASQPTPVAAPEPPQEAGPDLAMVLTLIRDAGTSEELRGASEMAGRLTKTSDKDAARAAYKARKEAMRQEAEEEARLEREAIQAEANESHLTPAAADFFQGES
jgi:hypothetical protein